MWIGGRTVEELYQSTLQRIDDLKNVYGYEVHVKWECEFREECEFLLDIVSPCFYF